ncbi:polyketide-type polyunsaturated fatty acid synthase PfaA [Pseudoduganella lurida]|uniref:Polyketide-type polyunsaturated fatty acid synthase PfaA n=1 Tax=Pseudoduganella lurida TaxID=1036180 RepID=A0A562R024_9BURK|nr:type I polyketide synthase [Pseudoduganella lurida]TWI62183.1 polyketide-type polyunsaturated fatty acid synthase PfaA [Pseudoduganella lurida]
MQARLSDIPDTIVLSPPRTLSPQLPVAACRAGALGLLDLGMLPLAARGAATAAGAIARLARGAGRGSHWGVRCDLFQGKAALLRHASAALALDIELPVLLLGGVRRTDLRRALQLGRCIARAVLLEVQDVETGRAAQAAGYDGLVVNGHEAGGRVGPSAAFVLAQECDGALQLPYWLRGGIGLHTAPAVMLTRAAGVVLCEQLWMAREAQEEPGARAWRKLDGSETTLVGEGAELHRFFARSGRARLHALERAVAAGQDWRTLLREHAAAADDPLLPAGQDIAFAAPLAERFGTAGRIITALRDSIAGSLELAARHTPLAPYAALADAHGTRYPIVQGPMTRVSDVAPFARAVAQAGALPFLALAVLSGPEVRSMLAAARDQLAGAPWGVGMLGFLPLELRQQQMAALREIVPPFAIIAGGRPGQAREMEALGITTYLHVPSPGLLASFLDGGARRFVFEGSECGGHTGPRTSFILWEQAVAALAAAPLDDPAGVHVLFAGGIHDALSAAMVAVLAAPLAARGMKVGVLMGTAYLFTDEIVQSGAIVEPFRQQAMACTETALLQSGVGIYTRCARTPFCDEFDRLRRELVLDDKSEEDTLLALETLNVGRLRIASKGIVRNGDGGADAPRYRTLDDDEQRQAGLYMLGEVARLRREPLAVADLHAAVSARSTALLQRRQDSARAAAAARRPAQQEPVAIVGMACHFPAARTLQAFWHNIVRGIDAIREVTDERWPAAQLFDPRRGIKDKVYSKWGGFLDDVPFDPQRYGIPPASLAHIEPAQLLTLEVARQALEDARFDRLPFPRGRTACIVAVGGISDLSTIYNFRTLLPLYLARVAELSEEQRQRIADTLLHEELPPWTEDTFPGILGNVVSGRIANRLDLGGSNFTVDAACASSLAALDAGVRQLRDGSADVALVGGVDCVNGPLGFMSFAQTHALSPRGRSRPFDAGADGIAISEGVGVAVLKRLADAERDGDRIYALVRGSGSASDGRHRSLTAPHPPGQVAALQRAYDDAGVAPGAVQLIEAHGTGTALGDRSEAEALRQVLGSAERPRCAVGSVKSMIGHTKVAAGMAGLIKGALALHQRVLPPTIGVERPIDALGGVDSPLYVNSECRPWLAEPGAARYCGVSAFGFGGTNFHAVLSEYAGGYRPGDRLDLHPRAVEVFALAGADRAELVATLERLRGALGDQVAEASAAPSLAQLAYSLYREQHVLRRANGGQPCRLAFCAASAAELASHCERALALLGAPAGATVPPGLHFRESAAHLGGVCFLFPGQGAQKINMLRDLVTGMPDLHHHFQHAGTNGADGAPQPPVAELVYPRPVFTEAERVLQQEALNATAVAQPALGMVEMAACELLARFGLQPDFVAGHSYGEYAALCAAGVITPDSLKTLSLARGALSELAPPGAMAAVDADAARTAALLAQHGIEASVANLNAPDQTIIAGSPEAIRQALGALPAAGVRVKQLAVASAFHCRQMEAVGEELLQHLEKTPFAPSRIPVYSNLTASPYPDDPAAIRALLARHIAEPVRFAESIAALHARGARIFIECGPGMALSGLVARNLAGQPHLALAIDAPGRNGWQQLGQLLCQALAAGLPLHLEAWFAGRGLQQHDLAEALQAAEAAAARGPLTWRVNGGRAAPWSAPRTSMAAKPHVPQPALPAAAPAMAPPAALRAVALPPVAARPPSIPRSPTRRSTMNEAELMPEGRPPALAGVTDGAYAQIQHGLVRLLDLQCEQQRSLRHFLEFQAQLAGLQLRGGAADPVDFMPASQAAFPVPLMPAAPAPRTAAAMAVPDAGVALADDPAPAGPAVTAPVLPALFTQGAALHADTPVPAPAAMLPEPAPAGPIALHPADAAPVAPASAPPTPAQFRDALLNAVSERTGYPVDMLNPDAHLEAELGIDSIKRIEIFSGLADRYGLVGDGDEESVIETLSGFRTLNEIVGWYAGMSATAGAAPEAVATGGPLPKKAPAPLPRSSEEAESDDPVLCYVVGTSAAALPRLPTEAPVMPGTHALLAGADGALAAALADALAANGYTVSRLIPGDATLLLADGRWQADLSGEDTLAPLAGLLATAGRRPTLLVNLMSCTDTGAAGEMAEAAHHGDARALFLLLKLLAPTLKDGGWLVNLTCFDGRFGLGGAALPPAASAGTLGVAKSVRREWPALRVKCIDAAPGTDPAWLAAQVTAELRSGTPDVEVGYGPAGRCRIDLAARPPGGDLSVLALDPGAVLLVTGGADGITADITRLLAQQYRPHLVLVGRSALPGDEAADTRAATDPAALKRLLIGRMRADRATPAQVDAALQRLLKDRRMRANLAAMRAAGCTVEYHALDVRDDAAFGALVDDVYARLGRIDGVLHGAGIISDRLLGAKSLDAFDAVFDTKVRPALLLARRLDLARLRFLVFFSSVAGRFGNIGQADYSAANEVLNKLAGQLCHAWPALHALAINWGPWDGGMVTDDLRRLYAAHAIRPIAVDTGLRRFVEELGRGAQGQPEVVISASLGQLAALQWGR